MIRRIPPEPNVYIVMWNDDEGLIQQRFTDKKIALDCYNHVCKYYGNECCALTKVLIDYGKKI